jgi:hypothetical protein
MASLEVERREATSPLDDVLWRTQVVTKPEAVTSPQNWECNYNNQSIKIMNNIHIKSTHETLEDAIAEAGGLNREYNAPLFDREVEQTKKDASKQIFYVVNASGRDIVCYHYKCDIELINGFSPFGSTLSGSTEIGWFNNTHNCFSNVQTISNNTANRKKIAEMQGAGSDVLVLNF